MREARNVILAVLAVLASAATPTVQANLLVNGNMESGGSPTTLPDGWSTWGNLPEIGMTVGTATDTYATPNQSMWGARASGPMYIWQDVAVEGEKTYQLDFWFTGNPPKVRVESDQGNLIGWWYFFFGAYGYYSNHTMPDYQGDPEANWIHATHTGSSMDPITVTTPPGTTWIQLIFASEWQADYKTRLDDVHFDLPPAPVPTAATLALLALGSVSFLVNRRRR